MSFAEDIAAGLEDMLAFAGRPVLIAGAEVQAIIDYGDNHTPLGRNARGSVLTCRVRQVDVPSPQRDMAVVIDSATWKVKSFQASSHNVSWVLSLASAAAPMPRRSL